MERSKYLRDGECFDFHTMSYVHKNGTPTPQKERFKEEHQKWEASLTLVDKFNMYWIGGLKI